MRMRALRRMTSFWMSPCGPAAMVMVSELALGGSVRLRDALGASRWSEPVQSGAAALPSHDTETVGLPQARQSAGSSIVRLMRAAD